MTIKETYILALDEGTSSAKAFILDNNGAIIGKGQDTFHQFFPKPGWVEQDPNEIWNAQKNAIKKVMNDAEITANQIASIGITNQRETTVIWDKKLENQRIMQLFGRIKEPPLL